MAVQETIGAHVSTKSTPAVCWSPLRQNLASKLHNYPSGSLIALKAQVFGTTFIQWSLDFSTQASFSYRVSTSLTISSQYPYAFVQFIARFQFGMSDDIVLLPGSKDANYLVLQYLCLLDLQD